MIFISWHQANNLPSITANSLSLTVLFQCVSAMGVHTTILEGEIFSVRISLSLERYVGGVLFHILHHIQKSPSISWVAATTQQLRHFCRFSILFMFQPILIRIVVLSFSGVESFLPHFSWAIIVISFCYHLLCCSISIKLCWYSLTWIMCSSGLQFIVHVLLRLSLPSLSGWFLK